MVEPGGEQQATALQRNVGIEVAVGPPHLAALRGSPRRHGAPPPDAPTDRHHGTISFFHDRRGYGFITGPDGADVFVHHRSIATKVTTGQRVEFAVRPGRRGRETYDVVAL